ncbi:unnamed protein product [Effrenium voratum]|nr:unnamed protein product [Effrenium voratum]
MHADLEAPLLLEKEDEQSKVTGVLKRFGRAAAEYLGPPIIRFASRDSSFSQLSNRFQLQREPFGQSFSKLLSGAQTNLETVGPYARLHLKVHRASRLLALDYCGTSDPYVEVWVNDIKQVKSKHVNFTLNPTWDFSEIIDIWSPFSIVTLRVVDWDRVTEDDPIGFVDFCVADLEPNGPEVRGWLELRKMSKMQKNARKRFLEHRRLRDDDLSDEDNEIDTEVIKDEDLTTSNGTATVGTTSSLAATKYRKLARSLTERKLKLKSAMGSASETAKRRLHVPCCGAAPNEDSKPTSRFFRKKALNAGQVEVSLRLEPTVASQEATAPLPELLYTAVVQPERIHDVIKNAEWYACCLPEPTFAEAETFLSPASIKHFMEEIMEMTEVFNQVFLWPYLNILLLIAGWYYWPLSAAALLFFWICVAWAADMVFTLPLLLLAMIMLLRDRNWANRLLAHPRVVPLNQTGFEMVAFLGNSKGMAVWLKRLVKDRGGWIEGVSAFKEFAKHLHKDGVPVQSFESLLETLQSQPWIAWHGKQKKCHCGLTLECWGRGSIRLDEGWCCYGQRSRGQDMAKNGRFCSLGLHLSTGHHLGRQRYHCTKCAQTRRVDETDGPAPGNYCGKCARGNRGSYLVSLLDSSAMRQLPIWRSLFMKAVKEWLTDHEPFLDLARDLLKSAVRMLDWIRDSEALHSSICTCCIGLSLTLYALRWSLGEDFVKLFLSILQLVVLFGGTVAFLMYTAPARRLRTAYRAYQLLARCHRWRRRGGCQRWQFFRPSEEWMSPMCPRVNSVDTFIEEGDVGLFPLSPYGRT